MNLLAGQLEPDDGRVLKNGAVRVGVLGQVDALSDDDTVERAVWATCRVRVGGRRGASATSSRGWLPTFRGTRGVGTLSGGQRRRVDLARLLIGDWDVLALDEPTNHLDARHHLAGQAPEGALEQGAGALLVVTHDRWFLDEVCPRMWEAPDRAVDPFEGGFSAYIMQRVERDRLAALAEQKRQNELRRELAWLSRGARARATKPKFHVAAAQALIADVPPLRNELELKRMAMARLGKQVVDLEHVTVRFDNADGSSRTVLDDVDWIIGPGDRYGIVGENGAGKTTLLRVIQGLQKPTSGLVKIGKTVRFAVLSQHLDDLARFGDDRVRQVVGRYSRRTMLDGKEMTPGQLLEKLGFTRADLNEPVCDLSGGQKRRLALMLILLDEPNVLVLDEPGNDLDTDMLASVEDLLDGWPGTLLLVTHDRYLMERVTDHQFALQDGRIRHLPGGVDEYLKLTEARDSQPAVADRGASSRSGSPGSHGASTGRSGLCGTRLVDAPRSATTSGASASFNDNEGGERLSGGEIRTLRKLMQSNERKTETLNGKIEDVRAQMVAADPSDFTALGDFQAQINDLQAQVDALEEEWLEAAEKLGE